MPGSLLSSALHGSLTADVPSVVFAGPRRVRAEAFFSLTAPAQRGQRANASFATRGDPGANRSVESGDAVEEAHVAAAGAGSSPLADDATDEQPVLGQDDEDGAANADEANPNSPDAQRAPGEVAADARELGKYPGWENTEGLPAVTVASPSDAYFSSNMADSRDEGVFKPTLGCKCGAWRPAPSHPSLEFRRSFLEGHPDFLKRVRFLKVNMAEAQFPRAVHWDATYDLKRFLSAEDVESGNVKLPESLPAVAGGGTQRRFMTFCPPEGGPAHTYNLRVTASDAQGKAIEYFRDKLSTIVAEPPASQGGQASPAAVVPPQHLETPSRSAVTG